MRAKQTFICDEIGVEIASFEEVKTEASRAMADFAKDMLPSSVVRVLAIEVQDDVGPVLKVSLRFEIEQVAPQ